MSTKTLTSQEISAKFHLPCSTVTHYTNLGLFTLAGRRGNKRLYAETEVAKRLTLIRKLVNEGFPLLLIRDKFVMKAAVVLIIAALFPAHFVFAYTKEEEAFTREVIEEKRVSAQKLSEELAKERAGESSSHGLEAKPNSYMD